MAIKIQRINAYPVPPQESAQTQEIARYVRRLHDAIVQADHARVGDQVYGINTIPSGNEVVGVNAGADRWEYKTLTAGDGITITPGVGGITITNKTEEGTTTGDLLRWNSVTEAWEAEEQPPVFSQIVLTPSEGAVLNQEGGVWYKSTEKSVYVCTDATA